VLAQVAEPVNGVVPSWGAVLRELLVEEGPRGLLRGVVPRMASSCLWGTCMVSAYEFLKRICALPDAAEEQ
jgi:solute carrier family 25 protein 44